MSIDYRERIPNNVSLADNRRLQRALESWQPNYLRWWGELGPEGAGAMTFTCAPQSAWRATGGRISGT